MKPASRNRTRTRCRQRGSAPPPTAAVTGRPTGLGRLLEAHVAASRHVVSAAPDLASQAVWRAACFQDERLAVMRAKLAAKSVTLVAVPADLWMDSARRARILALKRAAARSGRRVMIVPEGALRREPRLGNALLMAQAARALIGAEDRIAVMAALAEEPGMALVDLIEVIPQGPDRVAAVLSLARSGIVDVDLRNPIGPLSRIWLRASQM
jgi:hypothetical protein